MCYYFSYQKTASLPHLHFSYLFPLCPRKHPEAHGPGHSSSLRTTTGLSQLALLAQHVQAAWRGRLCGRHWKEHTMGNELPSTREAARPPLFSPSLLAALASCVLRGGGDGGLRTACGVRAVTVLLGAGAQGTGPCEDREWETSESPHCSGEGGPGHSTAKPKTAHQCWASGGKPQARSTAHCPGCLGTEGRPHGCDAGKASVSRRFSELHVGPRGESRSSKARRAAPRKPLSLPVPEVSGAFPTQSPPLFLALRCL